MNHLPSGQPAGILALWNDCSPENQDFYEHWYQTEHLPERLGIDGFKRGRRYEALDAHPRYFTYYETSDPSVLFSTAYIARLNDPTPATQKVMDGVFTNMSRTICQCVVRVGEMRGSIAITARLTDQADLSKRLPDFVSDLGQLSESVVRAEVWQGVPEPEREPTAEEKLRGSDEKITTCLFIEVMRRETADNLRQRITEEFGQSVESLGIYGLLCERVE